MGALARILDVAPPRAQVARMTRDVEELAERLAAEEHTRARFIGKVSHELRTPLTVIRGYAYTLQRQESDAGKLAKLDVITAECERLGYLVEDLLELSRARAGELRVEAEALSMEECVAGVVEALRPVADQRRVRLQTHWECPGARVIGDRNRIRQIFANLLTNAIKYAPAGTPVGVSGVIDGDQVVVSVEDAGRGIPEPDLPYVFDEFFQAAGGEPGAGLGLSIARELVVAHGGQIGVRSTSGSGTCFTVRLPVCAEQT
jgi:signal transduction histidine kinase